MGDHRLRVGMAEFGGDGGAGGGVPTVPSARSSRQAGHRQPGRAVSMATAG